MRSNYKSSKLNPPTAEAIRKGISLVYESQYNNNKGAGLISMAKVRKTLEALHNFNTTLSNEDIRKALVGSEFITIPLDSTSFCIGYPDILHYNFNESINKPGVNKMQNKKTRDPLNEGFNKLFKNILNESSIRDDIDADADDKKEYAKKVFMKKKDDADSDKDYKLKRAGLKEPRELKEAKWPLEGEADLELKDEEYVFDEDTGDIHIEDSAIHWYPGHKEYIDIKFVDDNDDKIYTYKLVEYNKEEAEYPWTFEYVSEKEDFVESKKCMKESSKRDDIDADADDKKEAARKTFMRKKDDADSDKDYKLKKADLKEPRELKEADKPAALSIKDAQKWVDYDMKKYGKISERTNKFINKAGFQIIKDDHGDYEVAAGKFEEVKRLGRKK